MGIKEAFKRKYLEYKENRAREKAEGAVVKQKEREAYYQARQKEAEVFGRQKAVYERKQRYKALSQPRTSMFGSGLSLGMGSSIFGSPMQQSYKPKYKRVKVRTAKRRRSKAKYRRVKVKQQRAPQNNFFSLTGGSI